MANRLRTVGGIATAHKHLIQTDDALRYGREMELTQSIRFSARTRSTGTKSNIANCPPRCNVFFGIRPKTVAAWL